jgi:serine/threonine protein kinase
MEFKVGDTLSGRLVITEVVRGGAAVVCFCNLREEDGTLREEPEFAVKSIVAAQAWDRGLSARFEREASIWLSLPPHPHIVEVFTLMRDSNQYLLMMEYMPGGDLRRLMESGLLEPTRAVRFARQICAGLEFLHARGIIHRDIKPANILLSKDDQVKISDLGIARASAATLAPAADAEGAATAEPTNDDEPASSSPTVHAILGTIPYMAPEQFLGERATEKSDQFSVGIVLYEMLTGLRPFSRNAAASDEFPPLRGELGVFQPLLERALNKAPELRYPSISEFSRALEAAAQQAYGDRVSFELPPVHDRELDPNYWNNKGFALARLDRYEESLECYERARSLDPDDWSTHTNMAVALRRLKRPEEALTSDERAMELLAVHPADGQGWIAHHSYASSLNSLDRGADALRVAREGCERYPNHAMMARAFVQIAAAQKLVAEREWGLEQLAKAHEADTGIGSDGRWCFSGIDLCQQGFIEEGLVVFQRAVERYPESGLLWSNFAVARHWRHGLTLDTYVAYATALELGRSDPVAAINIAAFHALENDPEAFETYVAIADTLGPHPVVEMAKLLGAQYLTAMAQNRTTARWSG